MTVIMKGMVASFIMLMFAMTGALVVQNCTTPRNRNWVDIVTMKDGICMYTCSHPLIAPMAAPTRMPMTMPRTRFLLEK